MTWTLSGVVVYLLFGWLYVRSLLRSADAQGLDLVAETRRQEPQLTVGVCRVAAKIVLALVMVLWPVMFTRSMWRAVRSVQGDSQDK